MHRCGRYPPEVRTAIPVDERFENIVLSCNATSDHAIIWIEREAEKALNVSRKKFCALLVQQCLLLIIYALYTLTHANISSSHYGPWKLS